VHGNAARRERQRDPPRADSELERGAVARQLGEEVDDRFDDVGREQVGGVDVVARGDALAEEVLRRSRSPR
jgi:hypothetical protein